MLLKQAWDFSSKVTFAKRKKERKKKKLQKILTIKEFIRMWISDYVGLMFQNLKGIWIKCTKNLFNPLFKQQHEYSRERFHQIRNNIYSIFKPKVVSKAKSMNIVCANLYGYFLHMI